MQVTNTFNFDTTEFAPAHVQVSGLTVTEKKLSAIKQASAPTLLFMANAKGKQGKAARENMTEAGLSLIASAAGRGHYRPLAEAIAAMTGETMTIGSRSAYDSLVDRFTDKLLDLKNGGYVTDKKTGLQKAGAKRVMLLGVIDLINEVQRQIEASKAE